MNKKKNILIIMGRYLPGYKDGGPVRTIKNLVDYLGEDYNFKILTCDRDHGDNHSYPNVKVYSWNTVGNAIVYYVPPKNFKMSIIKKLSKESDLVYCCGCFNDYAIKTLVLRRLKLIKVPVVVASMGLFSPNEFKIKYIKKKLFINILNFLGMFKNIYWSLTSNLELKDVKKQIKINDNYFIAEDLPRKVDTKKIIKNKIPGKLKIVWISRVAPKKNLKGAIQILQKVQSEIEFTIFGNIHNQKYWEECKQELKKLPAHIKWVYAGELPSEDVITQLKKHHIFLFPTLGENYGHVIQEALSAGCPVLLSDQTPWKNIENNMAGYVIELDKSEEYIDKIEKYASMNYEEFSKVIDCALNYVAEHCSNKVINNGYKEIFDIL